MLCSTASFSKFLQKVKFLIISIPRKSSSAQLMLSYGSSPAKTKLHNLPEQTKPESHRRSLSIRRQISLSLLWTLEKTPSLDLNSNDSMPLTHTSLKSGPKEKRQSRN